MLQRWVYGYLVRTSGVTKPVFKLGPIEAVWKGTGSVSIVFRTQGVILLSTREPCVLSVNCIASFLVLGTWVVLQCHPVYNAHSVQWKDYFVLGTWTQWHILHCTVSFVLGTWSVSVHQHSTQGSFYIGDLGCHSVTQPIVQVASTSVSIVQCV